LSLSFGLSQFGLPTVHRSLAKFPRRENQSFV
jgi:hypothetical protein